MMARMREVACKEDIPVSDIVRRATALWLKRIPESKTSEKKVPVINAGKCLLDANAMKEALYE